MSYNFTINQKTLVGEYLTNGAYGALFKICDGKRVLKIFRKKGSQFLDFIAENTCRSEILAYKKLQAHENLRIKAPNFFGSTLVEKVCRDETDISEDFLLNSAYIVEFIDCAFKKIESNREAKNEIGKFREIGVDYIEDADYCFAKSGLVFIDFAVIGVRDEIESIKYYRLSYDEKFKRFYEINPFLIPADPVSLVDEKDQFLPEPIESLESVR